MWLFGNHRYFVGQSGEVSSCTQQFLSVTQKQQFFVFFFYEKISQEKLWGVFKK